MDSPGKAQLLQYTDSSGSDKIFILTCPGMNRAPAELPK
jgi:hypothetical protein